MKKKFLLLIILLSIMLAVSFTTSFAAENVSGTIENGAKNVFEGAGNVISDGASKTKGAIDNIGNTATNATNANNRTNNSSTNDGNNMLAAGTFNNNNTANYTAARTSTAVTFLGMNATAWSWLIIGAFGVAIVALVWYYGRQHSTSTESNNSDK